MIITKVAFFYSLLRYIWQASIVAHTPSRMYFSAAFYTYYSLFIEDRRLNNNIRVKEKNLLRHSAKWWEKLFLLNWVIATLETWSLIGLTFLSSHGLFILHEERIKTTFAYNLANI